MTPLKIDQVPSRPHLLPNLEPDPALNDTRSKDAPQLTFKNPKARHIMRIMPWPMSGLRN